MMPGETPPVAAAAGLAAEAATACANCGALQQNLNEYVAALIALKQKIIDTDHLLTDYEQKCNELKCAERENHALRQQVEQMLQKLSPLEKCQEELGSVKAELEEKKSSLKIYQDTHQEYFRVKEEMGKSDAMKKKLEAKVMKLEKATEKHNQDFRQLKAEKKVLEKELKKAQEKTEDFPKEKQKKVVRHVETQSERGWPVANLDKEKIKLLLKELWLCIDNSAGKNINENDCYLADVHNNSRARGKTKAVHNPPKLKRARGERPSHCPSPETCTTQTSLTSLQIKLDSSPGQMENEAMEASPACVSDGAPYQGRPPGFTVQTDPSASHLDLFSKEPEETGEDLIEIWKWVRPLPPLLSPIQCSPSATPITLVEELTESSDEEMDQNAQKLESMVEDHDESTSGAYAVSEKYPKELLSEDDSSNVNNKSSDPCELSGRPTALKRNSSVLCSDPLAKSGFLDKLDAKAKDGEKQLEQNCEFIEGNTEISVHSIENITQKTADVTQTESKTLVCDLMSGNCFQGQEKIVEPGHALEVVTSSIEQALNESTDLIKKEKKGKLTRTAEASISCLIEGDQPPSYKGSHPQHTEEPVFATEDVPVVPGKGDSSDVIGAAVMKEDIQTESDFGRGRPLPERNSPEQNTTEESGTWCNGELEFIDGRMNLDHVKLHSKTNCHTDQAQDKQTEVMLAQAVEKDVQASSASVKLFWAKKNYSNKDGSHNDSKCDVNKKTELELGSVDPLRPEVHNTLAVDGGENSFSCSDEVIQAENKCSDAPCASKNVEGDVPKMEVENIRGQDKMVESVVEETPSPIITEGGLQLQDCVDQKGSSGLLQEEPASLNAPVLPTQVSVVKDGLSQPVGLVQTRQASSQLETVTGNASELEQFDEPEDKLKHGPVIHSASNSIPSVELIMEGSTSGRLRGDCGGPLKTAAAGTTELFSATECVKRTTSGIVFERPAQFCLVTGNSLNDAPSQEMTKREDRSRSPKPRKSSVEGMEMSECSVANEAALKVNLNGSSAPSVQEAPQAENAAPGAAAPVLLAVRSEPSKALFFARSGSGCNAAASGQSSDPPFISPSTKADHIDRCNSGEHLMDKEVDAEHTGGNQHKSLDYCSRNDQDEVEIKRAGERLASSETQAQVHVEGCCDGKDSREMFEAPCPNSASPVPTSAANQTIFSNDQGLVTTSREKIGSPSRNCIVEHPLNEAMSKETDKMLSTGVQSIEVETPDDTIAMVHVSASSAPEEYPLKKVNPQNKHSRLLSFKEELDTVRSSQADVPSSLIVSYGIHELPCLTEDASPKDEPSHNGDSYAPKTVANTWEHSYAAPYGSEKGSSILEASESDETEAGQSVALTKRAEVDSRELASGRLSARDLEVNRDVLSPEAEHRGLSAEPSAASSAVSAKQERTSAASERNSDMAQHHFTDHHVDGDTNAAFKKGSQLEKERDLLAAITGEDSIPVNSESSSSGKQEVLSQESELLIKSPKQNGAQQTPQQSGFSTFSAKAGAKGGSGRPLSRIPSRKGRRKSRQSLLAETIIANTDTSTSVKRPPKSLEKIRQEVGAPLPPLLLPLVATPPRTAEPVSPTMSSTSQLSLLSPLNELISPLRKTPIAPRTSLLSDLPKHKLPALQTTPSPSKTAMGEKTLSSPLQFCAITPKHALPVPGRLPPSAASSATPAVPQENSVKILDSMYPELSARAITLNILKGNIQLSRSSSRESKNTPPPVRQISGFKEIASSSTAFVKTGSALFSELSSSTVSETGKRTSASPAVPKSAKRLRLDSELLKSDLSMEEPSARDSVTGTQGPAGEAAGLTSEDAIQSIGSSRLILPVEETDPESGAVTVALEKISKSCFDLLPVIRSRVYAGNKSNIPIMTDAEKEVVYEFGVVKKGLAEPALQAIRNKLKHQKTSLDPSHIQSLCRVYVGICRQLGDLEKARLFCYSLLKEGFPQPGKLILFMGNMWSDIFTSKDVINRAVQLVARKCSRGQVLEYLETFLNWEESGPVDIGIMISSLLSAIQLCPQVEFQMSEQRGEDLQESMWEYVFAIDLLCSYQKWGWTHDHVISKELWPIMDKWIKNRKGSGNASSPSDVIVATVLRLIGRLSQIGLKEGFSSTVKNISSVIGDFLRHAKEQDVPWGVQLAAVCALCELGPSSPSEILEAIRAWETVNRHRLPPAVSTDIAEVSRLLEP